MKHQWFLVTQCRRSDSRRSYETELSAVYLWRARSDVKLHLPYSNLTIIVVPFSEASIHEPMRTFNLSKTHASHPSPHTAAINFTIINTNIIFGQVYYCVEVRNHLLYQE